MDHTRGGGSFFGFGAGCVTPGSDSGFWEEVSGAAFDCSALGVGGGGAIACGGVVDGMLGGCAGVLFCRFRSKGRDASGGRMADSGGRTRGTFILGIPYQFTVAKRSSIESLAVLRGTVREGRGCLLPCWVDTANGLD
jgi:hypothetical protein